MTETTWQTNVVARMDRFIQIGFIDDVELTAMEKFARRIMHDPFSVDAERDPTGEFWTMLLKCPDHHRCLGAGYLINPDLRQVNVLGFDAHGC